MTGTSMPAGRRPRLDGMGTPSTTDWRDDLRARGYRLTPQRELILQAVESLDLSLIHI